MASYDNALPLIVRPNTPISASTTAPPGRSAAQGTMPWAIPIGRVAGIRLYVHGTLLILLAWIGVSHLLHGQGPIPMLMGLAFTTTLFAVIVLHELGHALVAKRFGFRTRDITLLPIGGVARLERMPEKPSQELLVALAGPAVNLVLAAFLFGFLHATGGPLGIEHLQVTEGAFLTKLMWANVSLAVFNLLPAFPMDGGLVLRALLALQTDRARATELAARAGQGMALLFGLIGLFTNPMLLLIAFFVWAGARQEASRIQVRALLEGLPLKHAMLRDVHVLSPNEPLSGPVARIIAHGEHAFPVIDHGILVGVLTRSGVIRALADRGADTTVGDAMDGDYAVAEPGQSLQMVMDQSVQDGNKRPIAVVESRRIVGLVTPESVGEVLLLERARRRAAERT